AWLAEDSTRTVLLSQYCQFSADLDRLLPTLVASGAVAIPQGTPARRPWNPWMFATAGLLAGAVAVAGVWLFHPGPWPDTIATSVSQRREFKLADGTRVELNANTSVAIENGRAERRVRLADGEAYFIVSKDKSRPFIVETPAGSVRVTGTIFNVRTEATTELDVTVVEGSVQVRPGETGGAQPSGPVDIGAGDNLHAGGQVVTIRALSSAALEDALAWRQGQVVFDGVPLSEALARYSRYHGRQITATPGAAGLRVGGRYSLDDLDGFFAALEQALPVRVAHGPGGSVRVSLRNEPQGPGLR
ncbi:MAG TPA: FecR domain-containing protein, partial [Opitutaceae bacterium]|nr:FecR domain-containing protein [Opitutaceae bacterium]